jgi:hypothetical protein
MSCKSALFCINTGNPISLDEGASIPIGTIVRRFVPNITVDGTNILVRGLGYYKVNASFTLTPAATGTVTVQLFQDNAPVQGALATAEVAETDTTVNLSFPAIVRLQGCNCNNEASLLSFRIVENSSALVNSAITAEKM